MKEANSELIIENQDLTQILDGQMKLAFIKLVYLATGTNTLGKMLGNKELGEMIGLTGELVRGLKRNGAKLIARKKSAN